MLTLRDASNHLRACCEFWLVNADGYRDDQGKYVWINQLEISQGEDGLEILRLLMKAIAMECPSAVGAYWHREKTGQVPHAFRRAQLVREGVLGS